MEFVEIFGMICCLIGLGGFIFVCFQCDKESKVRIKKEKSIHRFIDVDLDFYYHELKGINESLRIIADRKEDNTKE